ncbi:MAG: hypothetical protein WC679_01705 [Bacteroidales bacterium]|jgi:hypothetical protein
MNIKITKEQHLEFEQFGYKEYIFGSHLFKTTTEKSDIDYIRVLPDTMYLYFDTLGRFLPNFNTWQYDDVENNSQYVWMTNTQFYTNLFSGDGHIISDVVLFSGEFEDPLFLCRTYKNIKGYLGLVKRDLKFFNKNAKKRIHCIRGLYIAECLLDNRIPNVDYIGLITSVSDRLIEEDRLSIADKLDILRNRMNAMYEKNELTLYPVFNETVSQIAELVNSNNMKEFTY